MALPFQTVETVNESTQDRQRNLLFESGFREADWRNRLIWGDKKYVLPSLLSEFSGNVRLVYIDPPFDTGADFSFTATVPDHPDSEENGAFPFTKEPSIIEQKAYRDIWGGAETHLSAYLKWFYDNVVLLHELLHEAGSMYVHVGPNVSHYCKAILDEVFGNENYRSEIVWRRSNAHNKLTDQFGPIHDVILFYSKSETFTFHPGLRPFTKGYIEGRFVHSDSRGRYQLNYLTGPQTRSGESGKPWRGFNPTSGGRHWAIPSRLVALLPIDKRGLRVHETLEELLKAELIVFPKKQGGQPMYKQYITEGVPYQDLWSYQPNTRGVLYGTDECIDQDVKWLEQEPEAVGYPTQKPEGLLRRILETSSNEDDLVLDCFAGSGTTAAVAEKLGRRWIACDLGRFAIHTTRKRLLSVQNVRPFIVQNLGKYERQVWAGAEFGESSNSRAAEQQRNYVEFILKLNQATPIRGYTWLHGLKGGRMIHVGAVDAPVSVGDVTQIAAEFKRAVGTGKDAPTTNGVDVLGWDFAFEINEVAKQQAAAANVQMRFLRIPRDVMDKRAVEQGDIKFFELAALSVDVKAKKRIVLLTLKDFVIPPDDVPEDARKAVKHWSQWIDYWAVDWDNKGDTFHNEWQTYRTRKDKMLKLETTHSYTEAGDYTIVVKVIDILGNDTTKSVKVSIG